MDYFNYQFTTAQSDIIVAFLGEHPFDTFEPTENGVHAFIPANQQSPEIEAAARTLAERFDATLKVEHIPAQNWNAVWEAGFQPIRVDDFVGIRADFHPPTEDVRFDLLINPKMAFGTGHHATTYQMVQAMRELNFTGQKVLDYGCGTGVLAILAKKLGADKVVAVDIEQPSYENTLENARLNDTPDLTVIHGTLDDIQDDGYGVVLANINRHVILASLATLRQKITPGGTLLLSGILLADEELVRSAVAKNGFELVRRSEREGWLCLGAERM